MIKKIFHFVDKTFLNKFLLPIQECNKLAVSIFFRNIFQSQKVKLSQNLMNHDLASKRQKKSTRWVYHFPSIFQNGQKILF